MYKIGLTGGIASGKSTVLNWFKEKGVSYIDADLVAREIVEPGQPCLIALVNHFGQSILLEDGSLDRKALGDIVFVDQDQREAMNAIFKDYIRERFDQLTKHYETAGKKAIIYDVPLLIEHGFYKEMDQVWLVSLAPEMQLERLMERNHLSLEQAQARIDSQMSLQEKAAYADEIIDNSGSPDDLEKTLTQFWEGKKDLFGC